MAITLGVITFDASTTAGRERIEEIGGRDAREIVVSGLIDDEDSLDGVESRLDAIVQAASEENFSAELSLRTGRVLFVRRKAVVREVLREKCAGSFALTLEARDPFEWAAAETVLAWTIDADPEAIAVDTLGTAEALPVVRLALATPVVNPTVGDGTRSLTYEGAVAAGQILFFDSEAASAKLDGEDVTPYTAGEFPRIAPGGSTLTYTDGSAGSPVIAAEIRFRNRWR